MCRVDYICDCNFGDEGDDDDTASTISSSIRIDNIERDATGTVSSIVRACDTDVSHHNRIDDLNLAKIPKALIEINSRRMNYFGKTF